MKMNPEVKTLWLEALKSGEYKKGTGSLRTEAPTGYRHCCLGVLCELYDEVHGEDNWTRVWDANVKNYDAKGTPIDKVWQWAGLKDEWGTFFENEEEEERHDVDGLVFTGTALTDLNDRSRSFEPVIEAIEKYL